MVLVAHVPNETFHSLKRTSVEISELGIGGRERERENGWNLDRR